MLVVERRASRCHRARQQWMDPNSRRNPLPPCAARPVLISLALACARCEGRRQLLGLGERQEGNLPSAGG
jgi:hypothetical protein